MATFWAPLGQRRISNPGGDVQALTASAADVCIGGHLDVTGGLPRNRLANLSPSIERAQIAYFKLDRQGRPRSRYVESYSRAA